MKRVSEVMTRELYAVDPGTNIETARRLLAERRISAVPVVNEAGEAVGVLSLSDLVDPERVPEGPPGHPTFYYFAEGWIQDLGGDVTGLTGGRVEEVMTRGVLSIASDTDIEEAARRLLMFGVHRLFVTDGQALVGVVSSTDLLRGFVHPEDAVGKRQDEKHLRLIRLDAAGGMAG